MDNIKWYSVTEYADEWNKERSTVLKWCHSGFVLRLGYKLMRDPTGHWRIGVPTRDILVKTLNTLM